MTLGKTWKRVEEKQNTQAASSSQSQEPKTGQALTWKEDECRKGEQLSIGCEIKVFIWTRVDFGIPEISHETFFSSIVV